MIAFASGAGFRKIFSKPLNHSGNIFGADSSLRSQKMAKFSMLDLFSGCGCLSLGFERAGFRDKVGVEYLEETAATWAMNRPHAAMLNEDARRIDFKKLSEAVDGVDIIVGGPPCEGFSGANKNPDSAESKMKRALMREALRAVAEIKPRAFVFENTAAINRGTAVARAKRAAESAGYDFHAITLRADDFGVPQMRKRTFMMGLRGGEKFAEAFDAAIEKRKRAPKKLTEVLSGLGPVGRTSDRLHDVIETSRDLSGMKANERLTNFGAGSRKLPRDVAFTIVSAVRHIHPEKDRFLSIREMARIQGIPDSYRFIGSSVRGQKSSTW